MHTSWFPSISLCVRCNVEKQCGNKTFIAPELMISNIAVFAQKYVTYNYCTAAYTIAMAVVLYFEKIWVQKNEY